MQSDSVATQWLYHRLAVFATGYKSGDYEVAQGEDGRWGIRPSQDLSSSSPQWAFFLDKRIVFGKYKYLPLNPERNWAQILNNKHEWVAWDDEASHADLVEEVMGKLGSRGWELVGIQHVALTKVSGALFDYPISYYIFKKPS